MLTLALLLIHGCATTPGHHDRGAPGIVTTDRAAAARAAEAALAMRGAPYRWGGEDPDGFDCSGLVHFAYAQAGVEVPRTSRQQARAVRAVPVDRLARGDLLFFHTRKKRKGSVSHVGLYVGNGRFVHALNPDAPVHVSSLDSAYWRERLVRAGSLVR